MTDAVIAADAPAISEAPVANATDDVTPIGDNPVKTTPEPVAAKPAEPVKKPTLDETLKNAADKVNAAEKAKEKPADDKVTAKEAVKEPAKATEKPVQAKEPLAEAKPATDPAKPAIEPPARWKPTAKEKWATVDDEVKAEVDRTVKELEKGFEKHKAAAEKYAALKEYDDIATANKTSIKEALDRYVGLEKGLVSQDQATKLAAIEEVFRVAKISPAQYAAHILGQTPDQAAAKADATIRQLQDQVVQLTQQVKGVAGTIEQQQAAQVEAQLNEWAADKPMAEKLAPQIAAHVQSGMSLDDAYNTAVSDFQAMVQSMGFIPQSASPEIVTPPPKAQNPKAGKSITGSPGAGSYQATQKPSSSIDEAVKRAFASLG